MDCALTGQGNSGLTSVFWQQWTEYQDQLYRCCLKLMNSNPTDAEDALSQAMLKAWEKVQKYAGKIDNLKAWLFKLTSNLCIDIIRKRSQKAVGFESIEWVGDTEEISIGSTIASPESCLEREEKSTEIRQAIANLPETLRETFILHFYQELTHIEIAQCQGISYENVSRRISRARKQLKEKLSSYFQGAQEDVISSPIEYLHFVGKKAEPTPNPSQEGNRRQEAGGKKEGCKVEGNYNCLSELDVMSSPIEYLNYGGNKAVQQSRCRRLGSSVKPLPQARQIVEKKEESSQLDSHELSFTTFAQPFPQEPHENSDVSAFPPPNVSVSSCHLIAPSVKGGATRTKSVTIKSIDSPPQNHTLDQVALNAHNQNFDPSPLSCVCASVLTKGIQEDVIFMRDGDSNGQNEIDLKEFKVETSKLVEISVAPRELAALIVWETGTVSVGRCNPNRLTIKGEPPQQSPMYLFGLSGICLQQRFAIALSQVSRLTKMVWGKLLLLYELTQLVCAGSSG